MTQYTADQLALKAHIDAENAAFAAHCKAGGATWWTQTTVDLDYWATMGVTDIEQYTRVSLIGSISDISKEMCGVRQRLDWATMTTDQLREELATWERRAQLDREADIRIAAQDAEEVAERERLNAYQPNLAFADLKKLLEKA